MDTALTIYSHAHSMFGVQHHRGDTLMAAFIHRYLSSTGDTEVACYHDSTGVCEAGKCSLQVTHGSWYHRPRRFHCASRRWTKHEKHYSRCLLLDWVEKVLAFLHTGDKGALVSPLSCPPVPDQKRCSLSISKFGTSAKASRAGVAHGPERPRLHENLWSGR